MNCDGGVRHVKGVRVNWKGPRLVTTIVHKEVRLQLFTRQADLYVDFPGSRSKYRVLSPTAVQLVSPWNPISSERRGESEGNSHLICRRLHDSCNIQRVIYKQFISGWKNTLLSFHQKSPPKSIYNWTSQSTPTTSISEESNGSRCYVRPSVDVQTQ